MDPIVSPSAVLRRWLAFVAAVGVVLALAPLADDVRSAVARVLGDGFVLWLTAALAALATAWVLPRVLRRADRPGRRLAWWVAVAAGVVLLGHDLGEAEWFHLVEYSALSILAFRALRLHIHDAGVYPAAAAVTALAGLLDETVQWLTPDRYWDVRDVLLNAAIGVAVQLLIWRGVMPTGVDSGLARRSLRLALRLWIVFFALVLLCTLNTPQAIAAYAGHVPFTGHFARSLDFEMTFGFDGPLSRRRAQLGLTLLVLALALAHRRLRPARDP